MSQNPTIEAVFIPATGSEEEPAQRKVGLSVPTDSQLVYSDRDPSICGMAIVVANESIALGVVAVSIK